MPNMNFVPAIASIVREHGAPLTNEAGPSYLYYIESSESAMPEEGSIGKIAWASTLLLDRCTVITEVSLLSEVAALMPEYKTYGHEIGSIDINVKCRSAVGDNRNAVTPMSVRFHLYPQVIDIGYGYVDFSDNDNTDLDVKEKVFGLLDMLELKPELLKHKELEEYALSTSQVSGLLTFLEAQRFSHIKSE